MAINLSSLSSYTTKATALSNLVLITPNENLGYQPQNPTSSTSLFQSLLQQPPSFLFNYEGEQTVAIEADITDHFVEDNTAIQDQIALKPTIITTHGFIGELNDVTPGALQLLKTAASKLTTIGAYTPELTTAALIAYNEAFLAYQIASNAVNSLVSAWSSLTGSDNQNKQQVAFQFFYGYFYKRTLFTVQTPWAIFQDMAIQRMRAIQDDQTRVITDFELTFKQIRTASTVTSGGTLTSQLDGRAANQASGIVDLGTSTPVSSTSLTSGLTTMGVA